MKPVCVRTHLVRRASGIYYFRIKIPVDLRASYDGKRELWKSLGTSKLEEAKRLVIAETQRQEAEFDTRRKEPVAELPDEDINRLSALWLHHILEEDEEMRVEGLSERDHRKVQESIDISEVGLRHQLSRGQMEMIDFEMTDFVETHGYKVRKDSLAYRKLGNAFLKSWVKATEMLQARQRGEVVDTPPEPALTSQGPGRAGKERLQDLLEYWKSQGDPKARKTLHEADTLVKRFEGLHNGTPVASVERRHVIALRDSLVEMNRAPATIRKHLGLLRSMFQVAIDDEKFGLATNPVSGVKVRGEVGEAKPRDYFTADELKRIFSSPVFANGFRTRGGAGEAAYWIPLIGLYTGARLNEIGQLKVSDIQESEGVWFFRITNRGEGQSLKVRGSRRRVPVHPELARLGLLKYAGGLREANQERLFPEVMPDSHGHLTGRWSKWWNRYLDDAVGIDDRSRDFHSFRHTFKHQCRACSIPEDVQDALTGHQNGAVARNYGNAEGYPLQPLAEAMRKLVYVTFELMPR
jgi:integrase